MKTLNVFSAADLAGKPVPVRKRRGDTPVEYDKSEVVCRGDALSRVFWQGRQWAVTALGIECRDGTYFIAAERLREDMTPANVSAGWAGWPVHMSGKNWVDMDDFITAWLVAMALHSKEKHGQLAILTRRVISNSSPQENRYEYV